MKDVKQIVKAEIVIKKFRTYDELRPFDIILVSEEDSIYKNELLYPARKIIYERVFERMWKSVFDEWKYRYDYYILKSHLKTAKIDDTISIIITGSSYGVYGIEDSLIKNAINLALPNQDLYYSIEGIYDVLERNRNIKTVIICCNYYYFYSDLSMSNESEIIMQLSKVYYPLFQDVHNCILLPPKQDFLYKSDVFDCERLIDLYLQLVDKRSYFSDSHRREPIIQWEDASKSWQELSEDEKYGAAAVRTGFHNKAIRYEHSIAENIDIFGGFLDFCYPSGIDVLLVVTPTTKYYLECLDRRYKPTFYEVINSIEWPIHILDLSESPSFTDDDFIDTDHLNAKGAHKMTKILIETIKSFR